MILTDEAALVLLALLAAGVLLLLGAAGLGLYLAMRRRGTGEARGGRATGIILILAVLGFIFGPNLWDRIRLAPLNANIAARLMMPDTLDLTGQRVLFIETSGGICGEFCSEILQIGTDVEAYWMEAGRNIPNTLTDNPIADILDGAEYVQRVQLGPANADPLDQRYPETGQTAYAPPYDVVIVVDESALLAALAPDLLGGPVPDLINAQSVVLVFTDWPDPYAAPPPPPTYRSITINARVRRIMFWPVVQDTVYFPPYQEVHDGWSAAICPFAGAPEDRDLFTYGTLCDPDSVNALFN